MGDVLVRLEWAGEEMATIVIDHLFQVETGYSVALPMVKRFNDSRRRDSCIEMLTRSKIAVVVTITGDDEICVIWKKH